MTENQYIMAGDIKTIWAAKSVLYDIVPANNIHIPDDEYRKVMRYLDAWWRYMLEDIDLEDQ